MLGLGEYLATHDDEKMNVKKEIFRTTFCTCIPCLRIEALLVHQLTSDCFEIEPIWGVYVDWPSDLTSNYCAADEFCTIVLRADMIEGVRGIIRGR